MFEIPQVLKKDFWRHYEMADPQMTNGLDSWHPGAFFFKVPKYPGHLSTNSILSGQAKPFKRSKMLSFSISKTFWQIPAATLDHTLNIGSKYPYLNLGLVFWQSKYIQNSGVPEKLMKVDPGEKETFGTYRLESPYSSNLAQNQMKLRKIKARFQISLGTSFQAFF